MRTFFLNYEEMQIEEDVFLSVEEMQSDIFLNYEEMQIEEDVFLSVEEMQSDIFLNFEGMQIEEIFSSKWRKCKVRFSSTLRNCILKGHYPRL